MASLTVRNIPDDAKLRFRQIAAAHGRSMEEHLRQLVLTADFGDGASLDRETGVKDVTHNFRHFDTPPSPAVGPNAANAAARARVEHLIALGRGLDFTPPVRDVEPLRDVDFG